MSQTMKPIGGEMLTTKPSYRRKNFRCLLWVLASIVLWFAPLRPLFAQTTIKAAKKQRFPIVIKASGSYVLESNLTVPTSVDALDVQSGTNAVTINLNGFVVAGNGSGIGINASGATGTTVQNGTVTGSRQG